MTTDLELEELARLKEACQNAIEMKQRDEQSDQFDRDDAFLNKLISATEALAEACDPELILSLLSRLKALEPKPISEAPKDEPGMFWLEWADDIIGGNPNDSGLGWQRIRKGCWSSVYKSTAWLPLSALPKPRS